MHRTPNLKPRSPHLSVRQPIRIPTAPLKSRTKTGIINDSLGQGLMFDLAEKIKEHPIREYPVREKSKVEMVSVPKTSHKFNHRHPIEEEEPWELYEQKRPQTSKGTRRAKQVESEYHDEEPEDLVMLGSEFIGKTAKDKEVKRPTTRVIFSAHTKRPKVVHLDEMITKNRAPLKKNKEVCLPFETSIDQEFLSLFANKK